MDENQLTYNIYYNIPVSPADMIIHQAAVAAAQHAGTPPAPTPIKEKLKQTIKRFSGGSQDDYLRFRVEYDRLAHLKEWGLDATLEFTNLRIILKGGALDYFEASIHPSQRSSGRRQHLGCGQELPCSLLPS